MRSRRTPRRSGPKRDVIWGNAYGSGTVAPGEAIAVPLAVSASGFLDPTIQLQARVPTDATLVRLLTNFDAARATSPGDTGICFAGVIAWPVLDNIGPFDSFPLPQDGGWDWIWRYAFTGSGDVSGLVDLNEHWFPNTETDRESHAMRKMGANLGLLLVIDNDVSFIGTTQTQVLTFDFRFAFKLPW